MGAGELEMKFYIAEGTTRDKLLALDFARTDIMECRNRFSREFKAKGCVVFGTQLVGLVFDDGAPKPWVPSKKLSKHVPNSFVPDNSKDGKELKTRMRDYQDPVDHYSVSGAVGAKIFFGAGQFSIAGFAILCGRVVVGLDERAKTPKGCKRISDTEYESLLKKEKRKRRSK